MKKAEEVIEEYIFKKVIKMSTQAFTVGILIGFILGKWVF